MATETTVKNIRAPQEIFDRLKALTDESFANQGAALEALLNAYALQQAQATIPSRETDIADFSAHAQALQRAFIHSLEIAENAEARARDAFRAKLESLEEEKAELRRKLEAEQEQTAYYKAQAETANKSAIDAADTASAHTQRIELLQSTLENERRNGAAQIADKQRLIDGLTAQLADAADKASAAEEIIKEADALKAELAKIKRELNDAQTAATVADAKAIAAQAQAVAAVQKETSMELLRLTGDNGALKVEIERTKAELERTKAQLAAALEAKTTNPAPMNDQQTAPTPKTPRKKAAAKKANATPANDAAVIGDANAPTP